VIRFDREKMEEDIKLVRYLGCDNNKEFSFVGVYRQVIS